jgi:hypothetical protein
MQKRITLLLVSGLFVALTSPIQAAVPVNLPEYWRGSDWLGFFTLASIAFVVMIRLKVLKLRVKFDL